MRSKTTVGLALVSTLVLLAACGGGRTDHAYTVRSSGLAVRGKQIVLVNGCGSCHTIPAIDSARGLVGPPLALFARRTYIAGALPNTPENLVLWIRSPQSVEPKTAMPDLGLTEDQARDVAAFLYTLR